MTLLKSLLAQLSQLHAKPSETQTGEDAFHLRLARLHLRETRRDVRGSVFFRNPA